MPEFEFTKDIKYTTWWREFYTVQADNIDEAIKIVAEEKVDSDDGSSEEIDDCLQRMTADENGGMATEQIFKGHDKPFNDRNILWSNTKQFKAKKDE